jgi:diadenosine tetraphosphate (Ap4A) HIT family hydrolase
MKDCIFCNKEKINDDIIYQTKNFFIKVGIGIFAPGHVMLIPKKHFLCYGELPEELEQEHESLKAMTYKIIQNKFYAPFLLEYCNWGQTVYHAHKHIIPLKSLNYEIKSALEEIVINGGIRYEEVNTGKLKEIYEIEKAYVTIEENGKLYACHVIDLKNKHRHPFLNTRDFFTIQKGLTGVRDWTELSKEDKQFDEEKRNLTKRILKCAFNSKVDLN